jgi:ABC-2 type transport system ATP-binding protein
MIETVNLAKRFDNVTAVEDLSIEVDEGEVFGFLGPNGAGKTTTIRMLVALISPTQGQATVAGF